MRRFLLLLASLSCATALADQSRDPAESGKPLWELGAGVGALSMPDYLGSDQRHSYLLPIPYVVYRGEFLKVDRDKVRGLFYKGEHSEWDISVGASVPVRSDDNSSRLGMTNLDPTFEIGPQWSYKLRDDGIKVTLRLPLRKVLAVDWPDVRDIGWVFTPTLALDRDGHPWPGWRASMSTGPMFGSRDYHAYYYAVSSAEATASRPAYNASAGYGGWQFTATLAKRYRKMWVGGFLRAYSLSGAAFEASPLVRESTTWMGGLGISGVFLESSARVPAE
jgi:outer membrane scaffolding protein for murein synthesis (MipA/OmpV family)